jgi:hypothetical protein
VEKHVCLSHDVYMADATWRAMMRIKEGVGDLVRRIRDDQARVGYSVAGQSRGQVMPCAIRIIHMEEMRSVGFPI